MRFLTALLCGLLLAGGLVHAAGEGAGAHAHGHPAVVASDAAALLASCDGDAGPAPEGVCHQVAGCSFCAPADVNTATPTEGAALPARSAAGPDGLAAPPRGHPPRLLV